MKVSVTVPQKWYLITLWDDAVLYAHLTGDILASWSSGQLWMERRGWVCLIVEEVQRHVPPANLTNHRHPNQHQFLSQSMSARHLNAYTSIHRLAGHFFKFRYDVIQDLQIVSPLKHGLFGSDYVMGTIAKQSGRGPESSLPWNFVRDYMTTHKLLSVCQKVYCTRSSKPQLRWQIFYSLLESLKKSIWVSWWEADGSSLFHGSHPLAIQLQWWLSHIILA